MRGLMLGILAAFALAIANLWWCDISAEAGQGKPAAIPVGKIDGVVIGADGKPEPAVVHLQQYQMGGRAETVTADSNGNFCVPGLPLGRYRLTIRGDLVDDIEITPGRPTAIAKLAAPPWAVLRGIVRDRATGKPVDGAVVFANQYGSHGSFRRVELGDRFEWAGSTPGKRVEVARQQRKPFALTDANGRYEMKLGDEHGDFFALAPGTDLFPEIGRLPERLRGAKELDFALERHEDFRVSGRVTHEGGKPFARGKIRFYFRRDPHYYRDLTTDEKGHYTFLPTNFLTGTSWLEVEGYSIMHQYVPLDKNPPFPPVDWVLKRSQKGTLSATFRPADGTPAPEETWVGGWRDGPQADGPKDGAKGPHLYYRVEADRWGRSGLGVTLKKGTGRQEMDPGTYAFSVALSPLTGTAKSARRDLTSYFTYKPATTTFSIEPGRTTDLKLTAPTACAVTAVITDATGSPVAGVNVAVFRWDEATRRYSGSWSTSDTNDKGEALFDPMPQGRYVFHPATGSSNFETLRRYCVTLTPGKHERIPMVVTAQELERLRSSTTQRYVLKVRGQVLMPDGVTPAAFAAVYVDNKVDAWVREEAPLTHADADGKFMLVNQPSGLLPIFARGHGTALTGITVKLGDGETPPVRLVLKRAATIHGRVSNPDGTPAHDVRVWLGTPTMSEPYAMGDPRGNGSFMLTTPVRRDGSFTLHGIAPGKQQLCAFRNGQLEIDRIVALDIKEGEVRKDVKLTLEPHCPGLEIHFKRADGKPMPAGYEARLHTDFGPFYCGGMNERIASAKSRTPLPVGRYHLWLEAPSYAKRDLDLAPGVIVRNIKVRPGKDAQKLEVAIPTAGAVKGRVVLPDGAPAAALRVAVHVPGGSGERDTYVPMALLRDRDGVASYAETWIDPDGNYALHGLVPGRYRLSVTWHGRHETLFASDPLDVEAGRVTAAGTWTLGKFDPYK